MNVNHVHEKNRFAIQHLGLFSQRNPYREFPLIIVWALWTVSSPVWASSLIPSVVRVFVLRAFGARIGKRCVLKNGIKVKHPWLLRCGDFVWIGENVWIDNIAPVVIGSSTCVSQGVYICTGNHDFYDRGFSYRNRRVVIKSQAWIGARCVVAPGTVVGRCSVVSLGSIINGSLRSNSVYSTPVAQFLRSRGG